MTSPRNKNGTEPSVHGAGVAMFLPPAWTMWDDGATLSAQHHPDGTQVTLTGPMRTATLAGRIHPGVALMAHHDDDVRSLQDAITRHGGPRPLERAALLKGSGYGQLFLELTARCNERCSHCYADSSPERDETLDARTIRSVLDDAAALGFQSVQLTGGDPLVSPHCLMAARHARAVGIAAVEVYTNGLALGGALYDGLRDAGAHFAFSFYSHLPDVHDHITGTPGSQRRTAAAIQRVLSDGVPARVNVIVMDANRQSAADTVSALHGLGLPADSVGIDVQRSVGRGLMTIEPNDPSYRAAQGRGQANATTHRADDGAMAFGGRAAVAYDGTVYPCIFSRGLPLGNVSETGLLDILQARVPLSIGADQLVGAQRHRRDQMSCWDCRLRAALLATASQARLQAAR